MQVYYIHINIICLVLQDIRSNEVIRNLDKMYRMGSFRKQNYHSNKLIIQIKTKTVFIPVSK